jgi:GAF domain-containing protein
MPELIALQDLCRRLDQTEITEDVFLEGCTRMVADTIECSRAGIWVFSDHAGGRRLRCLKLYDRVNGCIARVPPDERDERVAPYFDALQRDGHIVAADILTYHATQGYFLEDLKTTNVKSLMAAAFSVNGQLYGAVTCTQVGEQMHWTLRQLQTLKRMGARASLALHRAREASRLDQGR